MNRHLYQLIIFSLLLAISTTQVMARTDSAQVRQEDSSSMTAEQLYELARQQLVDEGFIPASNTFIKAQEKAKEIYGDESPLFKQIRRDLLKSKVKHLEERLANERETPEEISQHILGILLTIADTYELNSSFEMAKTRYLEGIDMAKALLSEGYVLAAKYKELEDRGFRQIEDKLVDLQFGYGKVLAQTSNHREALALYADSKNGFITKWERAPIMSTKHDYRVGVSLHSLNRHDEALVYFNRVLDVYENSEESLVRIHQDVLEDTERLVADSKSKLVSN